MKRIAIGVVAFGTLASTPAWAGPDDVWKDLAAACGVKETTSSFAGKLVYFGPLNGYGPGSIYRKMGGKFAPRLVGSALPQPPELKSTTVDHDCTLIKTTAVGGALGLKATAPKVGANGSISGNKVVSVDIRPTKVGWTSIGGFDFEGYYLGLGQTGEQDRIRQELQRSDTFVATGAVFFEDMTFTYTFGGKVAAGAQAAVKDLAVQGIQADLEGTVQADWQNDYTLVIKNPARFYVFGLLQQFVGAKGVVAAYVPGGSGVKSLAPKPKVYFGNPVSGKAPDSFAPITTLPE